MKKLVVLTTLILGICAGFNAKAQVRVNVNIGTPVVQEHWYTSDNDYYYLPEQDVYYNVRRRVYIFPEGGRWMYARHLPGRYGNYTYKTSRVIRIHDRSPFNRHREYRSRYYHQAENRHGRHDNGKHNGWNKHHEKGHGGRHH